MTVEQRPVGRPLRPQPIRSTLPPAARSGDPRAAVLRRPLGTRAPMAAARRAAACSTSAASFAYGSAAMPGRAIGEPRLVGIERDPEHLARRRERFPWIRSSRATPPPCRSPTASPTRSPCSTSSSTSTVREAAMAEAHRVLRQGGMLIVSVPHRGLLHRLDALNLYEALRRRRPHWPPLEPATESGGSRAPALHRPRSSRSCWGRGSPSIVSRAPGSACRSSSPLPARRQRRVRRPSACQRARARRTWWSTASTTLLPLGPLGYHLTVRARPSAAGRRAVSARVLFACWPFEGHVFPHLSVAPAAARPRRRAAGLLHRRRVREHRRGRGHGGLPAAQAGGCLAARARARAREPAAPAVAAAAARRVPRVAGRERSRARWPT